MNVVPFFTDSKNVWVSENFQNIFLSSYEHQESDHGRHSIQSADLQDVPSGKAIHEFVFGDPDTFLEKLALLIQDQINGEEGPLLNDSSANYFFLEGKDGKNYSILVRWEPAQKLWRCGAYLQEDLKMPNVRIFYPS